MTKTISRAARPVRADGDRAADLSMARKGRRIDSASAPGRQLSPCSKVDRCKDGKPCPEWRSGGIIRPGMPPGGAVLGRSRGYNLALKRRNDGAEPSRPTNMGQCSLVCNRKSRHVGQAPMAPMATVADLEIQEADFIMPSPMRKARTQDCGPANGESVHVGSADSSVVRADLERRRCDMNRITSLRGCLCLKVGRGFVPDAGILAEQPRKCLPGEWHQAGEGPARSTIWAECSLELCSMHCRRAVTLPALIWGKL